MLRRLVGVGAALILLLGCRGDDDGSLVLDGTPFAADLAGIVTSVSPDEIALDHGEPVPLADAIVVFSAASLERIPLAGRLGQYVQLGLDGDVVAWVASVGGVLPTEPPSLLFDGQVVAVDDGVVTFRSGCQLLLAPEVELRPDQRVLVTVDATSGAIVDVAR